MKADPAALEKKAKELRKTVFKSICSAGGGHIAGSLSAVEILEVLYNGILRVDPQDPGAPGRDRFILSKGHGGVALYAILAERGFFPREILRTIGKKGSVLGGHPDMHKVCGVEASTGSLGHGFCFGAGIALAGKLDKKD
ncbi:MAG: transketolase, partial [Candidatus Omnitrophota bacterium]